MRRIACCGLVAALALGGAGCSDDSRAETTVAWQQVSRLNAREVALYYAASSSLRPDRVTQKRRGSDEVVTLHAREPQDIKLNLVPRCVRVRLARPLTATSRIRDGAPQAPRDVRRQQARTVKKFRAIKGDGPCPRLRVATADE